MVHDHSSVTRTKSEFVFRRFHIQIPGAHDAFPLEPEVIWPQNRCYAVTSIPQHGSNAPMLYNALSILALCSAQAIVSEQVIVIWLHNAHMKLSSMGQCSSNAIAISWFLPTV